MTTTKRSLSEEDIWKARAISRQAIYIEQMIIETINTMRKSLRSKSGGSVEADDLALGIGAMNAAFTFLWSHFRKPGSFVDPNGTHVGLSERKRRALRFVQSHARHKFGD